MALKAEITAETDAKIAALQSQVDMLQKQLIAHIKQPHPDLDTIIANLPPIYIPAKEETLEVHLGEELPPMRFIVTTESGTPTQTPVVKHLSELVTIRLVPVDVTGQ